jgi:uncharacterized protein
MNRISRRHHPKGVSADQTFLTAEWQNLAMLNYVVDPVLLLPFVPSGTELDRWDDKAFVSLVGFNFLKTRLFGSIRIPLHSDFEEVNLRFYVRRQVESEVGIEVRRGVVFIREIVPRFAVAWIARIFYNENYCAVPMSHEIRPTAGGLEVSYQWHATNHRNQIRVETTGRPELPVDSSIEQFITEHYWGYAAQANGGCVEYRVAHPSWRVWQVSDARFEGDAEKFYGKQMALVLHEKPHSAFLAEGSDVTVMRGRRL